MSDQNTLSSLWDGLSPHLLATFYEVKKQGNEWIRTANCDPKIVKAPLTEASMEIALNWQSPFEQAGPESKAPALMAMLQSGSLQPFVNMLFDKKSDSEAKQKSNDFLSQFEGRTGITKLNSTQVFTGMPPVKIQVTALFRAWRRSLDEVEVPFDKLMEWGLPIQLSADGSILARGIEHLKGNTSAVDALMPSKSPTRIAMQYKGRTFSPLVIESIGMPLSSPIDRDGNFVEMSIPMTLCTLTALDRQDWSDARHI